MGMLSAGVDLETVDGVAAKGVLGEHALDGQLESEGGTLGHEGLVLDLFQTADPAGVTAVELLVQLAAGEDGLVGVDDDDEVAAVNVGGEIGLDLAAQDVGGDDSGAAQGLVRCVEDVPLALHVFFSDQGSGHEYFLRI